MSSPELAKEPLHDVLADDPALEDEFGPHSRIAGAIANLISGAATKGRCIALAGPWGSGKSSVILQLEEKLKRNPANGLPEAKVFLFDAWIHQSDPLRRCFLERLIEFAAAPESEAASGWTRQLDIITGRREITRAKQEKPASLTAVMIAASLLVCIPIASAFLGKYETKDSFWTSPYSVTAMVLYLIPALLGIRALFHGGLSGLAASVIRDLHQDTETDTVRTREASSIDFKKLFAEIARFILKDGQLRLVIVIDNLDRVDAQNAVSMWSTMRTFFDFDAGGWNERVWLVVPFDRSALRKLWKPEANQEGASESDLSGSFLEKTFQVVFHLAPPVLTTLQTYFEKQMRKVFDNAAVTEHLESVYRIYGLLGPPSPSPRQVKSFLNKLRAETLVWSGPAAECVSLPFLAVHVLRVEELIENSSALIGEEFLSVDAVNVLAQYAPEKDWRQQVAAAHFNVKPDEALQVLLFDRLAKAFQSGTFDPLDEVRKQPYFWNVFRKHMDQQHRVWLASPPVLANVILFADQSTEWIPQDYLGRMWEQLLRKVELSAAWQPMDSQKAKAIRIVLQRGAGEKPRVEAIVRSTLKSLSADGPLPLAQWVSAVDETLAAIREAGVGAHLKDFRIPMSDPAQFVEAQMDLIRRAPENPVWSAFQLQGGVNVAPAYVAAVKTLQDYPQFSALRRRVAEGSNTAYAALNSALLSLPDAETATDLGFLMRRADPPEADLGSEAVDLLARFVVQDDPDIIAATMVLASDRVQEPRYLDLCAAKGLDSTKIDSIVDALRSWGRTAAVCDPNWDVSGSTSLARACLQSLIRRNLTAEIPLGALAKLYPQLKQSDSTLASTLVAGVAARPDLAQAAA